MMLEFIAVMIFIVVWWCGLFAVLSGLGILGRRALGLPVDSAEAWILSFWSGWAFTILILQIWHLWLKIDIWAFATIVAAGTGSLLWNRGHLWPAIRSGLRQNFCLALIVLLLAFWIANRAMSPLENGDTGLYHMTAVRWGASYPIVPGLGNLHERLAFNSTFFLYAAMLEVWPWGQKSHYLANGLLLFVLLAQLMLSLRKIISCWPKNHSYHIFNVLLLAPAFGQMFNPNFSSLTPDISIFILGIVIISRAYHFFIASDEEAHRKYYDVFIIVTLCIVGMTIKLNFIPFGGSILIITLLVWISIYSGQDKTKILYWIILLNTSLLSIWVVRSVILSGYIFFPYTLGSVPVAWRVPRPLALSVTNWIHSWARAPGAFWTDVLGNWSWIRPWLRNFPYEYTRALITGVLALILYLTTRSRIMHYSLRSNYAYLAILGAPFISVISWFLSAPDPRFSGACFWMFGAGFAALAIDNLGLKSSRVTRILAYSVCLSFFIYLFPSHDSLFILPNQQGIHLNNFPKPEYSTVPINNLINLNIPNGTDQCWDIPIPCTPYYRPTLKIRKNHLDSGFFLDDTVTFADIHQASTPRGLNVSPGIGVALMGRPWFEFDAKTNLCWIRSWGTLLLYTEQPRYVKLSLKPFTINDDGISMNEGQLKISLNNLSTSELHLQSGVITEVVLGLRSDFNIITLNLGVDRTKRNEVPVSSDDTRVISASFYSIELTSIILLR
jgi:hypothetical protein